MRRAVFLLLLLTALAAPSFATGDTEPTDFTGALLERILELDGDAGPLAPALLELPGALDDVANVRRLVRIVRRCRGDTLDRLFTKIVATPEDSTARAALATIDPELAGRFLAWLDTDRKTTDLFALRFSGRFDGSDRIVVTMDDARWTGVQWGVSAGAFRLGGVEWTPRENQVLSNAGPTPYLPVAVDFRTAKLHRIEGRDTVVMDAGEDSVTIHVSDNPNGSGPYEFDVLFRPLGRSAELRITARIEGSDELTITRDGAEWRMLHWGWPHFVRLGDREWTPRQRPRIPNSGDTRFLPDGVDLTTARLVSRKGRDLTGLDVEDDRIVVHFVDSPIGAADYQVVIRFGP